MRRLPLHLVPRVSRKARWTALGIALCAGFAVLSFGVVEGLRASTYEVSPQYRDEAYLVSRPDFEPFDPLAAGLREAMFVLVAPATLADGREITLVAFESRDLAPQTPALLRPGAGVNLSLSRVEVVAPGHANFTVGARLSAPYMQASWSAVNPAVLRALDPSFGATRVTFVLTGPLDDVARAGIEREGLVVQPVPGVLHFFQAGAQEVARDLWLVVAFSSVLIGILAFEFMHVETREKRRHLGLWRALGMRVEHVVLLLLLQALLLAAAGFALGATVAVASIALAKQATGLAILDPIPDALLLAGVALATLAATAAGAAWPAWRASRGSIREALEAAP